jgi:YD repeat-containing protein
LLATAPHAASASAIPDWRGTSGRSVIDANQVAARGLCRQTHDGGGQGTRIEYDNAGRSTQNISPSGLTTSTSYDTQGRVISTIDPAGNVTRLVWAEAHAAGASRALMNVSVSAG